MVPTRCRSFGRLGCFAFLSSSPIFVDEIVDEHSEVNSIEDCSDQEITPDMPSRQVEIAIDKLSQIVITENNLRKQKKNMLSIPEFLRYLSVLRYLEAIRQGSRCKLSASNEIAKNLFGSQAENSYRSRSIRNWAVSFVTTLIMPELRQGKFQKTRSLIDDPDVRASCLGFLRSQRVEAIDGSYFQKWIEEKLHIECDLPKPVQVHESSARNWLHKLGFRSVQYKKGTYTDGHERADVVSYRKWLNTGRFRTENKLIVS